MNLYNKYRPSEFSEIVGNKETIQSIQNLLDKKEKPHSYLLVGETGCGKTTLGKIIAKYLGASENDFNEINSADFRGIDSIREIRQKCRYRPFGDCQIWLLDECHKLSNDAQNALLKLLESPPSYVYFILATTDPQKLIPTIKGRCIQYTMSNLNETQMSRLLKKITKKEKEKLSEAIYEKIIDYSNGHPRNAINLLEKVLNTEEENRLKIIKEIDGEQGEIIELCKLLSKPNTSWNIISKNLKLLKELEPESIRRAILGYFTTYLLNRDDQRIGFIVEQFLEPFYNTGFSGVVYACYSINKF